MEIILISSRVQKVMTNFKLFNEHDFERENDPQ
jgi:hypothetical protein